MARLGLGYDDLAPRNPRLVYASLTGYGQDGPWAARRAYAVVTHAEVGLTHRILDHWAAEDTPRNDPFSHADVYAGLLTLSGILAALHQREVTGRGQHVDVSMAQSLLFVNEHVQDDLSGIDVTDNVRSLGGGHALVLDTAAGRRVTVAGHPCAAGTFELFCAAMGRDDLLVDPRFATVADRLTHRGELEGIIRDWARGFDDLAALEAALGAQRLAMGVVRSVVEVADTAWAHERGAIASVDDRGGGTIRIPEAPWRFSEGSARVRAAPAYRGEHNREVLTERLGLDGAAIDQLEADGVLSSRVPRR
jgi:crotonobetainyl-CoA:carnitine CoA-transferase CaiB-like acyl-CoA transferase